jgi:hypothetical protein
MIRLLHRIVTVLAVLLFLVGLWLAALPGLLGFMTPRWAIYMAFLDPVGVLGLAATKIGTPSWSAVDFLVLARGLFACLVWLCFFLWLLGVICERRAQGRLSRWRPVPVLGGILFLLVFFDLPFRVSFALHQAKFEALMQEAFATPNGNLVYSQPRWVGLYPVQRVDTNPAKQHGYTSTFYPSWFIKSPHTTGFAFNSNYEPSRHNLEKGVADRWTVYRWVDSD